MTPLRPCAGQENMDCVGARFVCLARSKKDTSAQRSYGTGKAAIHLQLHGPSRSTSWFNCMQVLAEAFLMDLRDIFEYLALTDRFSLRSSSRLHAELPIRCEMTWNYKFEPVPMPCRPYSNLRKRQVTENNSRCNNQVAVWDGRCLDCRKFACIWHSTRITLDRFRRVNLCMPCQIARGMFR